MCRIIHYRFCVQVSNARHAPPNDVHVKCDIHHGLVHEIREGNRRAERDLRRHDRVAIQETEYVHYGQLMHDETCIPDPRDAIVAGPGEENLYFKRCDGSYKNSYGEKIQLSNQRPFRYR